MPLITATMQLATVASTPEPFALPCRCERSRTPCELQEHRRKRLDSPLSITEWARMMVLFAVDHPSGFKNLMKVPHKAPERTIALAHRLHTLAAVRNLVTHRASAGTTTLAAFRRSYYSAFEELTSLA